MLCQPYRLHRDIFLNRRQRITTILTLGLPIIGGMLSQSLLNLVDAAMVGRLGETALAGVALGGYSNFLAVSLILGLSSGVQASIARRQGQGRGARRCERQQAEGSASGPRRAPPRRSARGRLGGQVPRQLPRQGRPDRAAPELPLEPGGRAPLGGGEGCWLRAIQGALCRGISGRPRRHGGLRGPQRTPW